MKQYIVMKAINKKILIIILSIIWTSCSKDKAVGPIVEFEISGQILNPKDSMPLANISVQLGTTCNKTFGDEMTERIVTTNSNGEYYIKHKGQSKCTYFLYFNSHPFYNSNFYNNSFYFQPSETLVKNIFLYPYTTLIIKAINSTPSDSSKKVYISSAWKFCWCDSLTTNKAKGNGYTRISWHGKNQGNVNYDSIYTYADSVNTYILNY